RDVALTCENFGSSSMKRALKAENSSSAGDAATRQLNASSPMPVATENAFMTLPRGLLASGFARDELVDHLQQLRITSRFGPAGAVLDIDDDGGNPCDAVAPREIFRDTHLLRDLEGPPRRLEILCADPVALEQVLY